MIATAGTTDAELPPVVWVVDDDDLLRQALAATLAFAGYQVVQFGSAMPALDRVDAGEALDLLITDIYLGVNQLHGVALVSMVRVRRLNLPCILITAHDEIPDDAGSGIALLRKPLDLNRFPAQVRAVLGR